MKYFYNSRNFTIQYKILNFFGLSLSPLHNFNLLTQSEAVYEDFIFTFLLTPTTTSPIPWHSAATEEPAKFTLIKNVKKISSSPSSSG